MPLRISDKHYFFFLFCLFAGLGFWGAFYYVQHETRFTPPRYSTVEIGRMRRLSHQLHKVEYKNAHLESRVIEMKIRDENKNDAPVYTQSDRLARFMGLVQQEGPGVKVIVKDSEKPLLLGDNPNSGIVHNTDLVQLINDLRASGATAIAVNRQPITGYTGINCAGPIITVNQTRIVQPFIIEAIGNPKRMKNFLAKPESMAEELKKYGIQLTVSEAKYLTVPPSTDRVEAF